MLHRVSLFSGNQFFTSGDITLGRLKATLKNVELGALAPVVQTLDNAIHRINHYPADKYYGNQLCYPLDSD